MRDMRQRMDRMFDWMASPFRLERLASTGADKAQIAQFGEYSETIRLPAAVKTQQMKIDQENHEVRITLPKA